MIDSADRVLVVGSELAESGNCVKRMSLENKLLRIDIDSKKLDDKYPALVAICADAQNSCDYLNRKLAGLKLEVHNGTEAVARTRDAISNNLVPAERRHIRVLQTLRTAIHQTIHPDIGMKTYVEDFPDSSPLSPVRYSNPGLH